MPLTVLSDLDVRELIDTLSRDDMLDIQYALGDALHSYSTATNSAASECCSSNQPKRVVLKKPGGASTLIMPSTSDTAIGVKILSIAESNNTKEGAGPDLASLNLQESESGGDSSQGSFSSPSRASTTSSGTSLNPDDSPRHGSIASSMTSASGNSSDPSKMAKDITAPLGLLEPSATSPKGSVTLLTPQGEPRAIINASTLTAFRTAIASTALLKLRQRTHTLTVFGAGMQAYWHIYVTLILRPDEFHHIYVVNRDFERAQRLFMTLAQSNNKAVSDHFLSSKLRSGILTPIHTEYGRLLKEYVRAADVMFCCTPSCQPLFPASFLTSTEGRKKARYIVAIGSYKPHMQELHEDILRQAVRGPEEAHHHGHGLHIRHRHANEGGAIVVDTIEGALKEAGDIIKAGIGGQGIVELGELIMLKRSHWQEKADQEAKEVKRRERENKKHEQQGGHGIGHLFHLPHSKKDEEEKHNAKHPDVPDGGLKDWLMRGNVIYKSVGLGLMDLVVGMELVRIAEERGFGTHVPDF